MWEQLMAMLQNMPAAPPTMLDPRMINTQVRAPAPVQMAPRPVKPVQQAPVQNTGQPNIRAMMMNSFFGNSPMNWRAIQDANYMATNGAGRLGNVMQPAAPVAAPPAATPVR